jgi:hypothetical protein
MRGWRGANVAMMNYFDGLTGGAFLGRG